MAAAYQQRHDIVTVAVASQATKLVLCNTTCLLASTRLIRAECSHLLAIIHLLNLYRRDALGPSLVLLAGPLVPLIVQMYAWHNNKSR